MTCAPRVASCGVRAKQGFVWILVLALCVQGGMAAVSAVRGPAHVHAASHARAADPSRDHASPWHSGHFDAVVALAAGYAPTKDFPARVEVHHHDEAQHHYHLPGSDAVLVLDGHDAKNAEHMARGEPGSMTFLALVPDTLVFRPAAAEAGYSIRPATKFLSRSADRIERPPRSLSI